MRTEVIAGQYLDVHAQATADSSLQRASTVARAGVLPGDTQASHTAFISSKVRMSAR